jgi:UDP-glucose 4-epimerase
MRFVVTGGAGFIGSNLVKKLVEDGHDVTVFDIVQEKETKRLQSILDRIDYKQIDISNLEKLKQELKDFDVVAHFAASADIALGRIKTDLDLQHGTIATYNILESMRINNIKKIIFPSSSAVYGDFHKIPTTEDTGMLFPLSLYGASKLACEGLISAFCNLFEIKSWIFRFGNVVGSDLTRGVIKELIQKLKRNPKELEILGNGLQQKDFIHIEDCVDGILFAFRNSNESVNIFNLSSGTTTSVNKIVEMILEEMKLKNVKLLYTGGKIGWPGDAPLVHFDITKIKKLGWHPKYLSDETVRMSIKGTLENEMISP